MKELEFYGVVNKVIYPELPPHSEYSITELGQSLLPIIDQIEKWGDDFRPRMKEFKGIE